MKTRVYKVVDNETGRTRLVEGVSLPVVARHVAADKFTIAPIRNVAKAARLVGEFGVPEVAGKGRRQ